MVFIKNVYNEMFHKFRSYFLLQAVGLEYSKRSSITGNKLMELSATKKELVQENVGRLHVKSVEKHVEFPTRRMTRSSKKNDAVSEVDDPKKLVQKKAVTIECNNGSSPPKKRQRKVKTDIQEVSLPLRRSSRRKR